MTPPRVTMAEVAHDAGVSVMTVSYVYSVPERVADTTRERVLESARRLGYQGPDASARSLRQGRSNSLAVVVGEGLPHVFRDPQSSRFLAGVAEACLEHGQSLVLLPMRGDEGDAARIRESSADAFVLGAGALDGAVFASALASGRPVAIHGYPSEPEAARDGVHVVTPGDRAAGSAVSAVTFAGATAPAVVSPPFAAGEEPRIVYGPDTDAIEVPVVRERLKGVEDRCRELGIPWGSVPVVVARDHRAHSRPSIRELFDAAVKPDAVVALSDQLALAVVDVLALRGPGPQGEVAVSGWGDSPEAEQHGLTSVRQLLEEQGRQCALLALGKAESALAPGWAVSRRGSTA